MHVSLTNELEEMVHDRVESGMYNNASEVVREALRKFFRVSDEDLPGEEIKRIRKIVSPRIQAVQNGTAKLVDGEEVFENMINQLSE